MADVDTEKQVRAERQQKIRELLGRWKQRFPDGVVEIQDHFPEEIESASDLLKLFQEIMAVQGLNRIPIFISGRSMFLATNPDIDTHNFLIQKLKMRNDYREIREKLSASTAVDHLTPGKMDRSELYGNPALILNKQDGVVWTAVFSPGTDIAGYPRLQTRNEIAAFKSFFSNIEGVEFTNLGQ